MKGNSLQNSTQNALNNHILAFYLPVCNVVQCKLKNEPLKSRRCNGIVEPALWWEFKTRMPESRLSHSYSALKSVRTVRLFQVTFQILTKMVEIEGKLKVKAFRILTKMLKIVVFRQTSFSSIQQVFVSFHQFINFKITHVHQFINSSTFKITQPEFSSSFFINSSIHQLSK